MRLATKHPLHLTYSMNVHPGETWSDVRAAVIDHAADVRRVVAPNEPFGLGLRLAALAAEELTAPGRMDDLKAILAEHELYVFTINGFPYGRFHGERVKEKVYAPDWTTAERLDYTRCLARILADLAPADAGGSISTVPGSFAAWVDSPAYASRIIANLALLAADLEELSLEKDHDLHLGLEPEPSCWLDTGADLISFFRNQLIPRGAPEVAARLGISPIDAERILRRRIGICLDTCHASVGFEDLVGLWDQLVNEGIRISKVQLSAAVRCDLTQGLASAHAALSPFVDSVYLHQCRALSSDGERSAWLDLPDALAELPSLDNLREIRTHFHVPLFWEGEAPLSSTTNELTPAFLDRLRGGRTSHLEIETYTYDVLPPLLKSSSLVASIAREFQWTLDRIQPTGLP